MKKQFALLCVLLATGTISRAASVTWDADTATSGAQDGPGTWDTITANWWTGSADTNFANAGPDAPTFGAFNGAAGTVTLGADVVSGNITFNGASVGNYTIAGGSYILALTNRTIAANVSATISANIYGGSVTLANSAANTPTGTLTLSGNNPFAGGFTFGPNLGGTTGSARAASGQAFGTGTISFNPQGNQTSHRLELVGGITLANPITLPGRNNVSPAVESISGTNVLAGPITFAIGGGEYSLQVDGASSLTLSAPTAVTMLASGSRHLVLRGTGGGTVSGILAGGGASSATSLLDKAGSGTWTLAGANTLAAPTVVAGGTLALDYTTQNNSKLADGHALYLAGGTVSLNGGSHVEVVSSNVIVAGSSSVVSNGTSRLRLKTIYRFAGGTVDFPVASIVDTDTSDVNGILGGYATLAGADWAHSVVGAAETPITAYNGYTDIAAAGSVIADVPASNVRLNNVGGGFNITLGAATTTINTLLQNADDFPVVVDTFFGAGTILRLGVIGGVLVPAGKTGLTIGLFPGAGTLTAGGADNTAGEIVLINNSANPLTVNSTVINNGSGAVALTKAGSGSATLTGANTHSGGNYISGGTLNFSSVANLGGGIIVINGGTLSATATTDISDRLILLGPALGYGGGTINVPGGVTLSARNLIADNVPYATGFLTASSLTKTGAGTLVLGDTNTYTFGTIINGGTVVVTNDTGLGTPPGCYIPDNLVLNGGTLEVGTFTLNARRGIRLGPINGAGSGTIAVDATQTNTFNGQISDNWAGTGSLIKTGDGTLVLGGGVNDYSGDTIINAGTLRVSNTRAIPNGAGKGNLTVNGSLEIFLPNIFNGTNVAFNGLSGSGTVDSINYAGIILSVGNNNQSSTFNGTIQNTSYWPLELVKAGTGTFTLGGANTYYGATRVLGGVLALNGGASITSPRIAVSSNATLNVAGLPGGALALFYQTLSGNGAVLGSIDVTNTGTVAPGEGAGTLTVSGNVTLSASSTLEYELANVTTVGSGVNDLLVVAGTLSVIGPTTLYLSYLNGSQAASGKYTLIQYGFFAGNVTDLIAPPGFTITNNTAAKTIELIVTHPPASLTWRGDGVANAWDAYYTTNWILAGAKQVFYPGDSVTFDDSGSNSPAILMWTASPVPGVYPAATVVNATKDYTFNGYGIRSGSLTKSGSGTLTLEGYNYYSGGTIINGGTLLVKAPAYSSATGTGAVLVASSATLGAAGLISGPVTVQAGGTFSPGSPSTALGNLTYSLTVDNSVTLGGTTRMELNRTNSPASANLWANKLNYGGALVVSNLGPALQVNDTFDLFNWGTRSGSFTTISLPGGYTWDTTRLTVDGTIKVTAVTPPVLSIARTTTNTVALFWPSPSTGFMLQENTNSVSSLNWSNVAATIPDDGTTKTFIVNPPTGSRFYRLKL